MLLIPTTILEAFITISTRNTHIIHPFLIDVILIFSRVRGSFLFEQVKQAYKCSLKSLAVGPESGTSPEAYKSSLSVVYDLESSSDPNNESCLHVSNTQLCHTSQKSMIISSSIPARQSLSLKTIEQSSHHYGFELKFSHVAVVF